MNWLFLTGAAPQKNPFSTHEKRPPLGIGSLMSTLRKSGHKAYLIDHYLEPSHLPDEVYLLEKKIDFVGIYSCTICLESVIDLIQRVNKIRQESPWSGKIVVGGPHASLMPETLPETVDHICVGEGEDVVLLLSNPESENLPKILKVDRLNNIDNIPFMPWDIFDQSNYDLTCPWIESVYPVFLLNTSRSCPFSCTFCSVSSIWGKKYSFYSPKRIIDEIIFLKKQFNAQGIYFREDNFTLNKTRTYEFCNELIRLNINISWACESRVDTMCDESLVEIMSRSGCSAIYFGMESGSPKILESMKKQITVEQSIKAAGLCKKYGMNFHSSFVVGIPGEGWEDYVLTRKLIKRIKPYSVALNIFVGLPNSVLYRKIINEASYEYQDPQGLLYLPGWDVKCKYFYGRDSGEFVDYSFDPELRNDYDKKLISKMPSPAMIKKAVGSFLPRRLHSPLKKLYTKAKMVYFK